MLPCVPSNDDQDRKRRLADLYSLVAPRYAELGPPRFAYAGRRLVDLAEVHSGDSVLDLGTGRGAVLLPAAERVGPSGRAVGIDLAEGMVEQTSASLAERGWHWAAVVRMDADQLNFPEESFTHVLSSFSVFFFQDVSHVLKRIRSILRPGGTAGFAFVRRTDPLFNWCEDQLRQRGAFARMSPIPGTQRLREPGVLQALLESSGFVGVREVVEEVDLAYPDAQAWWNSLWTHGSRRALDVLTPAELADVQQISLERAQAQTGPNGLIEREEFAFIIARRPG